MHTEGGKPRGHVGVVSIRALVEHHEANVDVNRLGGNGVNRRAVSMTSYFGILLEQVNIVRPLAAVDVKMPCGREARYATAHDGHPSRRS